MPPGFREKGTSARKKYDGWLEKRGDRDGLQVSWFCFSGFKSSRAVGLRATGQQMFALQAQAVAFGQVRIPGLGQTRDQDLE